jgi:hypothetical protein
LEIPVIPRIPIIVVKIWHGFPSASIMSSIFFAICDAI